MELTYPLVLYIGIPILIVLIILISIKRKKPNYKNGKKIANTQYAKKVPYYQKILQQYRILSIIIKIICVITIVISLVLLSRPSKVETSETKRYSRDIFLCLDVSTSVIDLDQNLVSEMKDTVKSLKGERFGISIFNTSSDVIVPLTDDYEYVLETLDKLEEAFESYSSTGLYPTFLQAGTLVGNMERGSSIIGENLASCLYSFPNLEEERTRIVLFATDNDDYAMSKPVATLEDAGEIGKENKIVVYAICPKATTDIDKEELQDVVRTTGGELYTEDGKETVSNIVQQIESKQKTEIEGSKETKRLDKPEIPFIILLISIIVLFITSKKVKI